MDHCRANLAPYKVPVDIVFRAELPKTLIGKVLRRQLAAEVCAVGFDMAGAGSGRSVMRSSVYSFLPDAASATGCLRAPAGFLYAKNAFHRLHVCSASYARFVGGRCLD